MESKITVRKDHILVEPQEAELWEILRSLGELFRIPEHRNTNVIWVFRDGSLKVTFDDLYKIKKIARDKLPKNYRPDRKIAIVVETPFQKALASVYSRIEADIPVEFEVFSDLSTAENWINRSPQE